MKKINITTFLSSLSISIVASLFILTISYAKTEVLFSPRGSIKDAIIKNIFSSVHTIDITAFTFTSGDMAEALYNAKKRGVNIRVIVDERQEERQYPVLEFLKEEGFDLQFLRGNVGGSMNNTFAIFDGRLLVTGSYTWTEYAEKFNYENAVFIEESDVIEKYKKEFESLYDESIVQAVKRLGESRPRELKPEVKEVSVPVKKETLSASGNQGTVKDKRDKGEIPDDNVTTSVPGKEADNINVPGEGRQAEIADETQKPSSNITFNEFDKLFGSESKLTKSEKISLWVNEFEGKYVTWTGEIGFKGISVYDWNKIGIRHKGGNIDVNLKFDWTKQNKVRQLNVGDVVTYTGRLISLNTLFTSYRLDNADVLQIR